MVFMVSLTKLQVGNLLSFYFTTSQKEKAHHAHFQTTTTVRNSFLNESYHIL